MYNFLYFYILLATPKYNTVDDKKKKELKYTNTLLDIK